MNSNINKINNEININNENSRKNNSKFCILNSQLAPKVHCAIYTRKSSEDGLELEYNSLDNQYDVCASFIKNHESDGWVVVNKRYDDGGFSGGNLDRPALKDLMNDIALGLIDKIIIYKLDRISRSNIDYYKLADILQRKNIDIEIATQNFDKTTSIGRFSFGMMLNFAQLEREMTSDRITEKIRKQQSLGMWTGGIPPIGYDIVDKKLIVNEYEAEIVKLIFNTYYTSKSISYLLDILSKYGYKTKKFVSSSSSFERGGTEFNRGSIYKILNNKIYIGKIENKKANKVFNGIHKAIIDEELFNKVQETLKENMNLKMYDEIRYSGESSDSGDDSVDVSNPTTFRNYRRYIPKKDSKMPYLLRGMMKCECCNSILTPVFTTKKKSGITYRYYKSNKAIKHSSSCRIGNIPAEQIENIVLNQVYNVLSSSSIVTGVIERVNGFCKNNNEINKDSKDDNSTNNNQLSNLKITENEVIKYLQNIQAVWNELFPREQMLIIKAIIKEIKVSEFNIKIVFNNDGITDLLFDAGLFDNSQNTNFDNNNIKNNNLENNNLENNNSQFNNSKTNNNNKDNSSLLYEINIPVDFRYRAGRSFITTPVGKDISIINIDNRRVSNMNSNDLTVITAIIKSESWKSEIEKNKTNISCIAKQEGKSISYICKVLNLSFLAPDIKKSILRSQASVGISLLDLYECVELDWQQQRESIRIKNLELRI